MFEIKTKCQECMHAEVCGQRKQFEEWQHRMIQAEAEGNESDVFRADVSCCYFRKEKPVTRTIDLSRWGGY